MKEILSFFFQGVVVLFTIASTLLAAYSVQNKLRLRKVRLSWRAGHLKGYPLFASLFLIFIILLAAQVYFSNQKDLFLIIACYVWVGCMWFISSYLAAKHYITDYGIVKNINEPSQTIPWFQILDQVERVNDHKIEYTFSYSELNKSLSNGFNTLKIEVPKAKKESFEKILSLKLKNRFERADIPDIDLKRIQKD